MKAILQFIWGLAFTVSLNAVANPELSFTNEDGSKTNPIERIGEWFEKGKDIDFVDLHAKAFKGTCFLEQSGGALHVRNKQYLFASRVFKDPFNDDYGPGFNDLKEPFIFQAVSRSRPALSDFYAWDKSRLISKSSPAIKNESGTLSYLYDFEPNGRDDVEIKYRKHISKPYILQISTNLISQRYSNTYFGLETEGRYLRAGEIVEVCYYYEEIN